MCIMYCMYSFYQYQFITNLKINKDSKYFMMYAKIAKSYTFLTDNTERFAMLVVPGFRISNRTKSTLQWITHD